MPLVFNTHKPLSAVPEDELHVLLFCGTKLFSKVMSGSTEEVLLDQFPHANVLDMRAAGLIGRAFCLGQVHQSGVPFTKGVRVAWCVVNKYAHPPQVRYMEKVTDRLKNFEMSLNAIVSAPPRPTHMYITENAATEEKPSDWPLYLSLLLRFVHDNPDITVEVISPMLTCTPETVASNSYEQFPCVKNAKQGINFKYKNLQEKYVDFVLMAVARGDQSRVQATPSVEGGAGASALEIAMMKSLAAETHSEAEVTKKRPYQSVDLEGECTVSNWFIKNVVERITPEYCKMTSQLPQGDERWLDARKLLLTMSILSSGSETYGGSSRDENDVLDKKLNGSSFTGNDHTKHGNDHEWDGKSFGVQIFALGLADAAFVTHPAPEDAIPTYGSVIFVNSEIRRLMGAAIDVDATNAITDALPDDSDGKPGIAICMKDGMAPYTSVVEQMDTRGLNIHPEVKVIGGSHDGMFEFTRVDGTTGLFLVEIKCLARMTDQIIPKYWCQVHGLMEVMRACGKPVEFTLFIIWLPTHTRVFPIRYDPVRGPRLIKEAQTFWMTKLLPRFVMRDSGMIKEGSINPEHEDESIMIDVKEPPAKKRARMK